MCVRVELAAAWGAAALLRRGAAAGARGGGGRGAAAGARGGGGRWRVWAGGAAAGPLTRALAATLPDSEPAAAADPEVVESTRKRSFNYFI